MDNKEKLNIILNDVTVDLEFCKNLAENAKLGITEFPDDIIESVNYLLDDILKFTKADVIKLRIGKKMTYREISELYNLSVTRIREIAVKAYRILRVSGNKQYFEIGKTEIERKKKEINDSIKKATIKNTFSAEEKEKLKEIKITELELSYRIYTPLRRAGINSLYDIYIKEDFSKIRGIGDIRLAKLRDAVMTKFDFDILLPRN